MEARMERQRWKRRYLNCIAVKRTQGNKTLNTGASNSTDSSALTYHGSSVHGTHLLTIGSLRVVYFPGRIMEDKKG